jgi:hypothetical protein
VVGTWSVTASCLEVMGTLDLSAWGLGCSSGTVNGVLDVAGTWSAKSDGTYVDKTTTVGKGEITLPASCLVISGTTITCDKLGSLLSAMGYGSASCGNASGGGCTCWAAVQQAGWPGLVEPGAMTSGKYTTSGNVLILDGEANYSYCVSGSRMTWSPRSSRGAEPVMGTITFDSVPGSGGAGGTCPAPASNEELIDDLNDGDRYLPPLSGRVGAWKVNHDNSPNAKMFPSDDFVPSQTGDPCRNYACYVGGTGYVDWGASFSFGLGAPYNASKYKGITFWARVDSGTSSVIRVAFPDKDTDPDGNLCSEDSSAGANACYDHYGQRLTLTTIWTKYTVNFANLSHGGWGRGDGFDPATIYEVLFQIPTGATFGYWVDDVAFIF